MRGDIDKIEEEEKEKKKLKLGETKKASSQLSDFFK